LVAGFFRAGGALQVILVGHCLEVMRTLDADSVDAIVTDPPYHLTTGKKGGTGEASVHKQPSPFGAVSRLNASGFMGQKWDGGDIAFRPETWAEALRVAKPGAFLVAFGGTRTFHRLAVAIEDGGWELRDTMLRMHEGGQSAEVAIEDCPWLLAWAFGSGFPKSLNLDGDREGWGTALKPAFEPIVLARKPLVGTVAANVLAHSTGALNIDGCRIAHETINNGNLADNPHLRDTKLRGAPRATTFGREGDETALTSQIGRWPANLLHDGSELVLGCFPDASGQLADASSSSRKTQNVYGNMKRGNGREGEASADSENDGSVGFKMRPGARRGDSGSAARFFYCAKAGREDRNDGCEAFAPKPLNWPSGDASPGTFQAEGTDRTSANNHPTVKPTELMRWLCRLVTPPHGVVLDPFAGSGSTGRGAIAEGFQFVGIELNPEFAAIAEARIRAIQPGLSFA
jgi:site-specific DNA-methyltransferase (adenine-specific)